MGKSTINRGIHTLIYDACCVPMLGSHGSWCFAALPPGVRPATRPDLGDIVHHSSDTTSIDDELRQIRRVTCQKRHHRCVRCR